MGVKENAIKMLDNGGVKIFFILIETIEQAKETILRKGYASFRQKIR